MIQSATQSVTANPGQHLIPITGDFAVQDFAPSPYTLEIEITDPASNDKISERIPFEIVRSGNGGNSR